MNNLNLLGKPETPNRVGSMRWLGDWVSLTASNRAVNKARFNSGSLTEDWCEGSAEARPHDMSRCKWRRVTLVRQMVRAARPIATRRNPRQCAKSPNEKLTHSRD